MLTHHSPEFLRGYEKRASCGASFQADARRIVRVAAAQPPKQLPHEKHAQCAPWQTFYGKRMRRRARLGRPVTKSTRGVANLPSRTLYRKHAGPQFVFPGGSRKMHATAALLPGPISYEQCVRRTASASVQGLRKVRAAAVHPPPHNDSKVLHSMWMACILLPCLSFPQVHWLMYSFGMRKIPTGRRW